MNKTIIALSVLLVIAFAQDNFSTKFLDNTIRNSNQNQNNQEKGKKDDKNHQKPPKDEDDSSVPDLTDAQKELVKNKFDELRSQKLDMEQVKEQMDAFAKQNGISIQSIKKFLRPKHGDHHGKPKGDKQKDNKN